MTNTKAKSHPTLILIAMIAVFVVPMLAAWYVYHHHDLLSGKPSNKGQLITPPVQFQSLNIQNIKRQPITTKIYNKKWTMLLINNGTCTRECQAHLRYLHQIRLAVGKDQARVRTVVLTPNYQHLDTTLAHLLSTELKNTQHWLIPEAKLPLLSKNLHVTPAKLENDSIVIVDPLGNVMMYYTTKTPPTDILNDLEQLLKVSQIG